MYMSEKIREDLGEVEYLVLKALIQNHKHPKEVLPYLQTIMGIFGQEHSLDDYANDNYAYVFCKKKKNIEYAPYVLIYDKRIGRIYFRTNNPLVW